jgi:DNA-binding transcriptional LysR family regulator
MGDLMQMSDRIGNRMKLQDLHILMTVVQAGSMGKAAKILNTTQPNISRSIGELEYAMGVRLLDRHQRGVEPTECGRALLDCGVAVFDELRHGVKKVEFLADPTAGELRLGTTPFLAASFVSAAIARLSQVYPRITFHVLTGYVDALHRELRDRKVELLIVRSPDGIADAGFEFNPLFDDQYVVAAGAGHQLARRRKLELCDLVNECWVLPPSESVIGSIVLEAFRAKGLDYPRSAVVTDSPHMRVSLLATGRFITVFPTSAMAFLTHDSRLKALPVALRWPAGRTEFSPSKAERLAQWRRSSLTRCVSSRSRLQGKSRIVCPLLAPRRHGRRSRPASACRRKADSKPERSAPNPIGASGLPPFHSTLNAGPEHPARPPVCIPPGPAPYGPAALGGAHLATVRISPA